MEVKKTIRVKIHRLTNVKKKLLKREYEHFQKAVKGEDAKLYSATKQQAWRVKKRKKPKNEQPIRLRNDLIKVEKQGTKISKFWIKIPVYSPERRCGDSIWCPIVVPYKYEQCVQECRLGDSELVEYNGFWFVHLIVKKEVKIMQSPDRPESFSEILAVDMGIRWSATSVALSNRKTKFYGGEIREVREHYKMLRKKIGRRKVNKGRQVIKRIGNVESRTVKDQLHKISRKIVDDAKEQNVVIAIGSLKGLRETRNNGRKFNDKLHKFPFDKLRRFIKYKAEWEGIRVVEVDERSTSKTCSWCGSEHTSRTGQGKFLCKNCGLEDNADKNAALNIGKRALGKPVSEPLSKAGAPLAVPRTSARSTEEPHRL